jgi:hypothetical protein
MLLLPVRNCHSAVLVQEVFMDKKIAKAQEALAKQEAHINRMIAHNPSQPSIKSAKLIAEMYRAELANLQAVR